MVIITQLAGDRDRNSVPEYTMQMLCTVKINSMCLTALLRAMLGWVQCTTQSASDVFCRLMK